jgi:hypothetical protein
MTQDQKSQIAEELRRNANVLASYDSKNPGIPAAVSVALTREMIRLRELADAVERDYDANVVVKWELIKEWPLPVSDDARIWVRRADGEIQFTFRSATFTQGWLWWCIAPVELCDGKNLAD